MTEPNSSTTANTTGSILSTLPPVSTQPTPITYIINNAPEKKKVECDICHEMFSIQGIDSHKRLKHGVRKGKAKEATPAKAGIAKAVETQPEGRAMDEDKIEPEVEVSDKGHVIKEPIKKAKEPVMELDEFDDDFFDEEDEEEDDEDAKKDESSLGILPLIFGAAVLGIIAYLLYTFIIKKPQVEQKVQDFSQGENVEPLPQQFQPIELPSLPQPEVQAPPMVEPQQQPEPETQFFRAPEQAQVPKPARQKNIVLLGKAK